MPLAIENQWRDIGLLCTAIQCVKRPRNPRAVVRRRERKTCPLGICDGCRYRIDLVELNAADLGRLRISCFINRIVGEGVRAIFIDGNTDICAGCDALCSTIDGVADLPDTAAAFIIRCLNPPFG